MKMVLIPRSRDKMIKRIPQANSSKLNKIIVTIYCFCLDCKLSKKCKIT